MEPLSDPGQAKLVSRDQALQEILDGLDHKEIDGEVPLIRSLLQPLVDLVGEPDRCRRAGLSTHNYMLVVTSMCCQGARDPIW